MFGINQNPIKTSTGAYLGGISMRDTIPDSESGFSFMDISEEFRSSEFSLIGGTGYQWENRVFLGFRFSSAMSRMYEVSDDRLRAGADLFLDKPVVHLRNYYLTIMGGYEF